MTRDLIVADLAAFYGNCNIHVGAFACPHRARCEELANPRPLMAGMEAHVGSLYGQGTRIVVVSLDAGGASQDLEARTTTIDRVAPDNAENSHMYGTALFVQHLLNAENPPDLPMAHVAMLNSAKCGGNDGTMNTVPSAVHYQCRQYLFEELRILEPDIVWLQGNIVRQVVSDRLTTLSIARAGIVSPWLAEANSQTQRLARLIDPIAQEYFRLMAVGERKVMTILTPHPSDRYGRWGLFQRSVMPLIADLAVRGNSETA